MIKPNPESMIEKFNRQIQTLLRHEENEKQRRKKHEQKLEQIFERDHSIDIQKKEKQDQILSLRITQEQQRLQKLRQLQFQEEQIQKEEKKKASKELAILEQLQQEKEFQQKMKELKTKMNYEEFRRKTDELIAQLNENLRKQNQLYLDRARKKERYQVSYLDSKRDQLNQSSMLNDNHFHQVLANYNTQMQRIQELFQSKVDKYKEKIKLVDNKKQMQNDQAVQRALQKQEHINQIQQNAKAIHQTKMQQYQQKVTYFLQKIQQIEDQRMKDLENSLLNTNEDRRVQARARSENYYRNRSENFLLRQDQKQKSFQKAQETYSRNVNERLEELGQKYYKKQEKIQIAQMNKDSYLSQLEQRIMEKDKRLQDQINEKNKQQKRRLQLIDDMERQRRDLFQNLENSKLPITTTNHMSYLFNQNQSKLFIT
ncbi:hypothetical protein pb186bvf_007588 [Paramecium bursaria]